MQVQISEHLTHKKIFFLTIFPITTMIFTSLYSMVDGIFISNFASPTAFAGVNLIYPFIAIVGAFGFMLGTGGVALVSKQLGEKKNELANKTFSLIIFSTLIIGCLISLLCFFFVDEIVHLLGSVSKTSSIEMEKEAIEYGRILMLTQPLFMVQICFNSFVLVAQKPKLGFIFTLASGLTNIVGDLLFVGIIPLGVKGAALATTLGYVVGSIGPMIYFYLSKTSLIKLGKFDLDFKSLFRSSYNGISEFLGQISTAVVSIIYNIILLGLYGEVGVSAYGIIMYVSFIFGAIQIGYNMGVTPPIGYNYGAQNHEELHNIVKKAHQFTIVSSISMMVLSLLLTYPFAFLFSGGSEELFDLAVKSMLIYSLNYLVFGIPFLASSIFTALNNGTISGTISFLRTFLFRIMCAYLVPLILGSSGIWWSMVISEALSLIVSYIFLKANQKKYHY